MLETPLARSHSEPKARLSSEITFYNRLELTINQFFWMASLRYRSSRHDLAHKHRANKAKHCALDSTSQRAKGAAVQ